MSEQRLEKERHFLLQKGRALVRTAEGFPKENVKFVDLLPILTNPSVVSNFAASLAGEADGVVIVPESRGYLFAVAFSLFGLPVVCARKPGKRPIPKEYLISVKGSSEYGTSEFELDYRDFMQSAPFLVKNENGMYPVTIFDDILATGGTVKALQESLPEGFAPVKNLFIAEIQDLNGRDIIAGETKSLIQF